MWLAADSKITKQGAEHRWPSTLRSDQRSRSNARSRGVLRTSLTGGFAPGLLPS